MEPKPNRRRLQIKRANTVKEETMSTGTVNKKRGRRLYSWEEIPDWQKDNEHIRHGYVRETNSFLGCFDSLFYMHNESVNIYTHLLPGLCFFFVVLFDKVAIKVFDTTTFLDYIMVDLFFLGAFTCLILSSTFHCLKTHSLRIAILGNKLDYLGIVALIVSSMISIMYYGFFDSGKFFYGFSTLTLVFGIACAIASLSDTFRSREWRPYRAALFVAFGLSAVLPIFSGVAVYGFKETWVKVQVKWVLLGGVFYIIGALLYALRLPERISPGTFDIWGHSHQIFHILVVIAALCHLKAVLNSYELVHKKLASI